MSKSFGMEDPENSIEISIQQLINLIQTGKCRRYRPILTKRCHFLITKRSKEALEKLSKRSGFTPSFLAREILDRMACRLRDLTYPQDLPDDLGAFVGL